MKTLTMKQIIISFYFILLSGHALFSKDKPNVIFFIPSTTSGASKDHGR